MSVQCPDGEHSMVWPKGSMSYLICERCDFTFGEVPPVADSAHRDVVEMLYEGRHNVRDQAWFEEVRDAVVALLARLEQVEQERDVEERFANAYRRQLETAEAALREIAEDTEANHYSRLQAIARRALAPDTAEERE